jgi:nicotinamide-nucleotide amidase
MPKKAIVIVLLLGWVALAARRGGLCAESGQQPASTETKPVDYVIIVTGGEILAGAYADAHTPFLTRTLQLLGCRCVGSLTVDDEPRDLKEALRFATNRAPLVIVTGGLGPTPNDITRDTLSEFTGIPLREDPGVLAEMERRFGQTKEQLRPNLRRQTLVAARGTHLKNPGGTAVGLVFDSGASVIVALPGPPRELQPMARNELVPYLQQRFGVHMLGCSVTLRFVGAGQSLIDQTIKDHVPVPGGLRVTSSFEDGRVDFTFSLPEKRPVDQARLQQLEADIREHLGQYIYANDDSSLEEVVVRQMRARGLRLVLAEIGSGGILAAKLSQVDGMAQVLAGAYSAPSADAMGWLLQIGLNGGASFGAEKAKTLAAVAASASRANGAIAVGPVESNAEGARFVWIAFRFPDDRCEIERVGVRGSGETAQASLATQVLDWLRRQLK